MDYDVLVVGSGIGGMESALKLGDMGYKVLVVEKEPSVGGKMILLSKVFPTLDCASCISTPKMAATVAPPECDGPHRLGGRRHRPERQRRLPREGAPQAAVRRRVRCAPAAASASSPAPSPCPTSSTATWSPGAPRTSPSRRRCRRRLLIERAGTSPCTFACPAGIKAHGYVSLRPQRRVREGVRPRAGDDAARRQPRTRLLRAVRGAVHARKPRRPRAHSPPEALRRRRPLRARRAAGARAARAERQARRRRRLRPCRSHRSLAARAAGIRREDLRGGARAGRRPAARDPVLPSACRGRRARRRRT